ncbi:YeeE/YedE family protein [Hoeflea sp.]|uniref:YeeE/YedE family protein n=1 Tax=Hoeflea sp. TaxID=1940281 RepID=UPI003B021E46
MVTEFTPTLSLTGGFLIGIAAILLMVFFGRIAGMTGIVAGIIPPVSNDWGWRLAFLAGAIAAPAIFTSVGGQIAFNVPISTPALMVGGLIVGIGVTIGSGCTSGHGVCGIARLSMRSIVATLVFMTTTAATVFVVRHLLGGL